MSKVPSTRQPYCTEINSLGLRCSHLATRGTKCAFHDSQRIRCAAFKDDGSRCIRVPMVGLRVCASHAGYSGKLAPEVPFEHHIIPEEYPFEENAVELEDSTFLLEITDAKAFAKAVLESRDFRQYIVQGLKRRDLSPTILIRLMDYAEGWGKPPERIEHTGKDGQPIVTEVRRVVIRVNVDQSHTEIVDETVEALPPVAH